MTWEIVVDPGVIDTLYFFDPAVANTLLDYLENHLAKISHPPQDADSKRGDLKGITTISRNTEYGVVMIFAHIDYDRKRIKILHLQLRNNAYDQSKDK
jgi:hypothetical protein